MCCALVTVAAVVLAVRLRLWLVVVAVLVATRQALSILMRTQP